MSEQDFVLAYQNYQINENPETAFKFISQYLRITDNATILSENDKVYLKDFELLYNYMLATIQLHVPAELFLFRLAPHFLARSLEKGTSKIIYAIHGILISNIIKEIKKNYEKYLEYCGENIQNNTYPKVDFVGWLPKKDQLVIIFHTLQEQIPDYLTYNFWYFSLKYDLLKRKYIFNQSLILPPFLTMFQSEASPSVAARVAVENFEDEHPGIVPLFNNLFSAIEDAGLANRELREGFAEAQNNLDKLVLAHIKEMAEDLPRYTRSQLRSMPTIMESHFSNLKEEIYLDLSLLLRDFGEQFSTQNYIHLEIPEGPHIRVWLSRMTPADGDEFNYPVEIEIFDPTRSRWEEFIRYQS